MFSIKSCILLGFQVRSLIHFELIFVYAYRNSMIPAAFIEKPIFSHGIVFMPLSKVSCPYMYRVSPPDSLFCCTDRSIITPVELRFDQYSFVSLNIRQCQAFNFVLFKICCGYSRFFASPLEVQKQLINFYKNKPPVILTGIAWNLQINLGRIDAIEFSEPLTEGIAPFTLRSSVALSRDFQFSVYRFFM